MKPLFILIQVFFIPLFFTPQCIAGNLSYYRSAYTASTANEEDLQKKSWGRIERIRAALGTKDLVFSEKVGKNWVKLHSVPRPTRSSLFIKKILSSVSKSLHNSDRYGKPIPFDPSLFGNEIDKKVSDKRNQFCNKFIGKNSDLLVHELWHLAGEARERRESLPIESALNAGAGGVGPMITSYLSKVDTEKTLLAKVGTLYQVEVVDNQVTRLRFSKLQVVKRNPYALLAENQMLTLSLEMLATFLSGYDSYFLEAHQCLFAHLSEKRRNLRNSISEIKNSKGYRWANIGATKLKNLNQEMTLAIRATDYSKVKLVGAQAAHRVLRSLSSRQINILTDLLLQLRKGDVPVSNDILPLTRITREYSKKFGTLAETSADRDLLFYSNLEEELYRMEDALKQDKKINKLNQQLISEINTKRPI